MQAGQCKSCGASIIWAKTAQGRMMPVDAQPIGEGFALVDEGGQTLARGRERFYQSHFVTCPNAADHRRRATQNKETFGDG